MAHRRTSHAFTEGALSVHEQRSLASVKCQAFPVIFMQVFSFDKETLIITSCFQKVPCNTTGYRLRAYNGTFIISLR